MASKRRLQKFAADNRKLWDKEGIRQAVRDELDKITKCRTPLLGAEIYASDSETIEICHTCKSRFCPGCGNRATLTWQREQWRALPDVRYAELCFTMPNVFWGYFKQDRRLLSDIAALAASVIKRWIEAEYDVVPYVLVIPHTFGRRLNFHPHLHILVSAGGINKRENRWINFREIDKYVLMYWWRFTVINYLADVLRADAEDLGAFDQMLKRQGKRPWNIHIKRFSSKWHFLRYAARYLRRPPIAEYRIIEITDEHVEYWADLKLRAWVKIKISVEEFLELLIQHVPEKYAHAVRYFGLASPAGKHLFSSAVFAQLGEEQKPRPKRLSFEAMSLKYFDLNPLLDSHGQRMRWVGRQSPTVSLAAA
jgi:Putative transposase/Transposase zinc-binding domain